MPRPDKFYLIEIVDDPRGLRRTEKSSRLGPDGFVPTETTTTSERLKFTLQFGRTYGMVTGRFGIKESTGGAGIDLHLLRDRLLLSVDVFDTKFNNYPRVQARASLAVWDRHLYLVAGVDDVMNKRSSVQSGGGFDYFFGGQLIFNDEDLKSMLLVGGGAAAGATK